MKLTYPINKNYVQNKGLPFALQELISNGLDAEIQYSAPFKMSYNVHKQILTLTNSGVTLSRDALILGVGNKTQDDRLIGQHGEGLKLALLILAREGLIVRVNNGRSERWTPKFEYVDQWQDRVLVLQVDSVKRQVENFEIFIQGVSPELWDEAEARFLRFRPAQSTKPTCWGDLLEDADLAGRVYVKGVYVTTVPSFRCGYNFKKIDTGRDRQIPLQSDIEQYAAYVWDALIDEQASRAPELFDMLNRDDNTEVSGLRWSSSKTVREALATVFIARYGDDTIPVSGMNQSIEITHSGGKAVILQSRLVDMLQLVLPMQTYTAFMAARKLDATTVHTFEDLTPAERTVLTQGLAILSRVLGRSLNEVNVVTFRDPRIDGTFQNGQIRVNRTQLCSIGTFLGVMVHELAHHMGTDGSLSHVQTLEFLWAAVADAVYAPESWNTIWSPGPKKMNSSSVSDSPTKNEENSELPF